MMRGLWMVLFVVALVGCQGSVPERDREQAAQAPAVAPDLAPDQTAPATSPQAPPHVPVTSTDDLVGEYRVAGAGGRGIDLPHGITARIDDTAIIVNSGCVKMSWVWFFEDGRLVTERLSPRESCGRELMREESAVAAAFDGAISVGRTPANGVEFAGENGSVLLFGQ